MYCIVDICLIVLNVNVAETILGSANCLVPYIGNTNTDFIVFYCD